MSTDPWPEGGSADDEHWDALYEHAEEERKQRVKTLWRRFGWLANEAQSLWGEREGHASLAEALEYFKPAKRKKGVHDPKFEDALLAAYRAAPTRKKMAAVFALGAERGLSEETTTRRWRRLISRRKAARENLGKWAPDELLELP